METERDVTACLEQCLACQRVCVETLAAVMARPDDRIDSALLRTLMDCSDICATSAQFLLRRSDLHGATCAACADVCAACARSCEAIAGHDALARCAQTCRRCAASCEEMASGRTAARPLRSRAAM
jgi:hypothetical protein